MTSSLRVHLTRSVHTTHEAMIFSKKAGILSFVPNAMINSFTSDSAGLTFIK